MRPDEVAAVVDAIKTGFWSLGILPQGTFELINTAVNERVKEAVEAEREACAKLCDDAWKAEDGRSFTPKETK